MSIPQVMHRLFLWFLSLFVLGLLLLILGTSILFWRLSEGKFKLPPVHNLHQLAIKQSLLHLFKMREGLVNMDFDDYFRFCNSHNTRNHEAKNLKILKYRLDGRKNSFANMIVPWYNRLNANRETHSVGVFKKCVDEMIEKFLPTPAFDMKRRWWGTT